MSSTLIKETIEEKKQLHRRGRCIRIDWHRYYDPETGRYLTPDPIGLAGGINPFVYSLNNPVNYTDPLGLETATGFGSSSPGLPFFVPPGSVFDRGSHANDLFVRDMSSIIQLMDPRPLINDTLNLFRDGPQDPTNPEEWINYKPNEEGLVCTTEQQPKPPGYEPNLHEKCMKRAAFRFPNSRLKRWGYYATCMAGGLFDALHNP